MLRSTAELPRQTAEFVLRTYGTLSQTGRFAPQKYGKAMVWIMSDRTMVIIQNDPSNPNGVIRSTYPIREVEVTPKWMKVTLQTPVHAVGDEIAEWEQSYLGVVAAPCVCGAGPTGVAAPLKAENGTYVDIVPAKSVPDWVNKSL